jgi:hypothetical protein
MRLRVMMRIWGETIISDLIAWVLASLNRIGMWRTPLESLNSDVKIAFGFATLVPLLKPRWTRLSRGPTYFLFRSIR